MGREESTSASIDNIKTLVSDFLVRYGERGRAVLEAAVRASTRLASRRREDLPTLPGDFDYRTLVEELGLMGYSYNPSPILRILERDYGIIRTTLHTSRQRWFIFSSPVVRDFIEDYIIRSREGIDDTDPDFLIVKTQLVALNIDRIREFLTRLSVKERWSETDYEKLKRLSREDLPLLSEIYKKARERDGEKWESVAREIEGVFRLLNKVILAAHKSRAEERGREIESVLEDVQDVEIGRP